MKKKTVFIIIGIICIILSTAILVIAIRNKKPNLDYQLEVVSEINYMVFMDNSKYGVINKNGEVVVEAKYDEIQIPNPSKPLFVCKYDYDTEKNQYKFKVLNEKSEQILYQYVIVEAIELSSGISPIPYEKSVLKYVENNKYGLIDFDGKVVAKPNYDEIASFDYNEGLLLVKKNGKYGIININGVTVVNEEYDRIESDGYYEDNETQYKKSGFIVGKNVDDSVKYGYINRNAEKILDTKYDQIDRIENPDKNNDVYLVAFENGQAGFYKNKDNVIKHEFEDIGFDKNNKCLILQKNSKQGLADFNGNIQIDLKYDNIFISGKYVNAQNSESIDIYDYSTKQKINYENIVGLNQTISDKYSIAITDSEKFKIIDNEKNELKQKEYDYLEYVYGDYFITYKNKKFGIIDSNGDGIVDFKYDSLQKIPNTNLVQAVNFNKNTTDIIKDGKVVASMSNAEIWIKENYLVMNSTSDRKYINFDGETLENTELFELKLYACKQSGKWGFVNSNGENVIECKYDFVTEFNTNGFAGIKQNGKWGVINLNGEIIVEPKYEIDSNNPNFIGKYYELDKGYGYSYYVCQ